MEIFPSLHHCFFNTHLPLWGTSRKWNNKVILNNRSLFCLHMRTIFVSDTSYFTSIVQKKLTITQLHTKAISTILDTLRSYKKIYTSKIYIQAHKTRSCGNFRHSNQPEVPYKPRKPKNAVNPSRYIFKSFRKVFRVWGLKWRFYFGEGATSKASLCGLLHEILGFVQGLPLSAGVLIKNISPRHGSTITNLNNTNSIWAHGLYFLILQQHTGLEFSTAKSINFRKITLTSLIKDQICSSSNFGYIYVTL